MDFLTEHRIAVRFLREGTVVGIQRLGNGLVNDTFLVTTDSCAIPRFVLQKINREVFPNPEKIMANLGLLDRHLGCKNNTVTTANCRLPSLHSTSDGKTWYVGRSGEYWRALVFIENSMTCDRIESNEDAEQVGFALGCFHNLVRGLDPTLMQDTLPGFHRTPRYLSRYDQVAACVGGNGRPGSLADLQFCQDFVNSRRHHAGVLEKAKDAGRLMTQVIHGDPKLNNILFDKLSRKALAMIDLDTVKPGLIHYDIGDCLRSCCNIAGELPGNVETARFDLDICEAILLRYFQECGSYLTPADIEHLYDSIRLLPFELGLRFLSDHLEGNRYFKVDIPDQNLSKALVQFKLVMSVEKQEQSIRRLIVKLASDPG